MNFRFLKRDIELSRSVKGTFWEMPVLISVANNEGGIDNFSVPYVVGFGFIYPQLQPRSVIHIIIGPYMLTIYGKINKAVQ